MCKTCHIHILGLLADRLNRAPDRPTVYATDSERPEPMTQEEHDRQAQHLANLCEIAVRQLEEDEIDAEEIVALFMGGNADLAMQTITNLGYLVRSFSNLLVGVRRALCQKAVEARMSFDRETRERGTDALSFLAANSVPGIHPMPRGLSALVDQGFVPAYAYEPVEIKDPAGKTCELTEGQLSVVGILGPTALLHDFPVMEFKTEEEEQAFVAEWMGKASRGELDG